MHDFPEEPDFDSLPDQPSLERIWSATVIFEDPPEGVLPDFYWLGCLERAGGTLLDLSQGHIERIGISLELRIECTTSNLLLLLRRDYWKALRIAHIEVQKSTDGDVGGEG